MSSQPTLPLMPQPLTRDSYAPFGDLISADCGTPTAANQGTAQMVGRLTAIQNLRPDIATQNWKIYSCTPYLQRPVPITLLEKHPYSCQLFAPLGQNGAYLVVVAHGDSEPDLTTIRAFIATPQQAVTYRPGVWHMPMTLLDQRGDMLSVVYEDGSPDDCVLYSLPPINVQID